MFYEKLKKILDERDLNLKKLAEACEFNQSGTSRYKDGGMPRTDQLVKICKYLNVSADYLLDLEDSPPPPILTELEAGLLEDFRLCSPERQQIIIETARSGAEDAKNKEKSLNLQKIG